MPTTSIPGVETFHPRSTWEQGVGFPITGDLRRDSAFDRRPGALSITGITHVATHYTAAINIPDGDPGEILDGVDGIRNLLRNAHWDYLTNRTSGGYRRVSDGRWFPGYPLGYSFAIDWLGGVWEINGFDYQPAATSGWNSKALAWLMLTDRADPGSDLMWQSHRALSAEAQRRGANIAPDRVWSHGWFAERTGTGTPTGCCGDALEAQINAGMGDWTQESHDMNFTYPNRRLLDTRTINADINQLPEAFALSVPEAATALDMEINVQVVQAQGDGWISANGQSALVYDSGRASGSISIKPATGIDLRVKGAKAHVIVDLTKVVK